MVGHWADTGEPNRGNGCLPGSLSDSLRKRRREKARLEDAAAGRAKLDARWAEQDSISFKCWNQ